MLIQSEQIDQLASALADVQSNICSVIRQSRNEAFGSRYAELSKVWEAFQRVGPSHGLSVVQMPGHFDTASRTMTMSVRLMHNSGQWLGGEMSMPLSRADAHAYGSACTYARRYSLAALVGICPHDDDGNEASGIEARVPHHADATRAPSPDPRQGAHIQRGRINTAPAVGSAPAAGIHPAGQVSLNDMPAIALPEDQADVPMPADPQQFLELRRLIGDTATDPATLCRHYGVNELEDLSPADAARARWTLSRKLASQVREAL